MEHLLQLAANHGLNTAMLLIAVYWLNSQNLKKDAQREAERKEAHAQQEAERIAFREERDKRISALETEIHDCKADRVLLRQKQDALQQDHFRLLMTIIEQKKP